MLPADTRETLEAPECALPMSRHDAIRDQLGRIARVSILASCFEEETCNLWVRIHRPPEREGAWETLHAWRVEVPGGAGQIARFVAAVPNLAPPPPEDGALLGSLSSYTQEALVEVTWLAPAGRWRSAPTSATIAEGIQRELDACHEAVWSSGPGERAVLSFGRDGSVTRCEARLRDPVDPARRACICGALSNARVSRGPADRRVELGLSNRGERGVLAGEVRHYVRFETTETTNGFRSYRGLSRVTQPAARCFAMAGITNVTAVGLRIFADGHGRMTRAEIDGTGLSPEIARCLQGVLRPLAFSCPAGGGSATWSGRLVGYTRPR